MPINCLRFGTAVKPNLVDITSQVFHQLTNSSETYQGFRFYPQEKFESIKGKNYRAKAIVEVSHRAMGIQSGKLVLLLMAASDGTGDNNSYDIPGLKPYETPRNKTIGDAEIMLPIGTAYWNTWIANLACVSHIGMNKVNEPEAGFTMTTLGTTQEEYFRALRAVRAQSSNTIYPSVQRARFTQNPETGFGNAHAIAFPRVEDAYKNAIPDPNKGCLLQVVGFLALPKPSKELLAAARALTETSIGTYLAPH